MVGDAGVDGLLIAIGVLRLSDAVGVVDEAHRRDLHELHLLDRGALWKIVMLTVLRSLAIVTLALVCYFLLPLRRDSDFTLAATTIVGVLAISALVVWQIGSVARSSRPSLRAVEAVVTTAALLAVVFASTYLGLSDQDPASFSEDLDHVGALYFTMTTLATIGYGDIVPTTNPARIVVMLQMVVNVAVLGVAVKVLAGTARARVRSERPNDPQPWRGP
jgi:hypothetical protein